MAKRTKPLTPWAEKVETFRMRRILSLKEIADEAGVNYNAFLEVRVGRTPGHEIIPAVDAYMERCAATSGGEQ